MWTRTNDRRTNLMVLLAVLVIAAACSGGGSDAPVGTGDGSPGAEVTGGDEDGPGGDGGAAPGGDDAGEPDTPPPWAGGPPPGASEDPDEFEGEPEGFRVSSEPITQEEGLVRPFTCDGVDPKHPPFIFGGVPEGTVALAIVLVDVTAGGHVNWQATGIPPDVERIEGGQLPPDAVEGPNSAGGEGYDPPCPPPGETHEYVATVFALTEAVDPPAPGDAVATYDAAASHRVELRGSYARPADAGDGGDQGGGGQPGGPPTHAGD